MSYIFEAHTELSDYLGETEASADFSQNASYINSALNSFGFPSIGNLFSDSPHDVKKTLDCLYSILAQKQKDLNVKDQLMDTIAKLKSDRNMYSDKADRLTLEVERLQKEVGRLQTSLSVAFERMKKEKEQSRQELGEVKKDNTKLSQREAHYIHEIKKKDFNIAKLKDNLRRQDKDLGYRNHVDLTDLLHSKGPKAITDADSEFAYMIAKGYDDNVNALLTENQDLRNAFETLQRELFCIVSERKEALGGLQFDDEMEALRREVLDLPFQSVSEDVIGAFSTNIQKFKEFIEKTSALLQ